MKKVNTGEVLIKLQACGISYNKSMDANRRWSCTNQMQLPSHELTGIIEEIDDNVTSLSKGDHVGLPWIHSTHSPRGHIHNLLNSNQTSINKQFEKYIKVPAELITPLPKTLSFTQAAPLFYAGLTAYAALNLAQVQPGETVAILGIKGIGHLALQFAYIAGADVIALTRSRNKVNQCHDLGASDCIVGKPEDQALVLKELGGADVLISTLPSPYDLRPYIDAVSQNSRMILVGAGSEKMTIDADQIIEKQIQITGAPVGTKQDMKTILNLAAEGIIRAKTKEYLFEDACEALDDINEGRVPFRAILTV